MKGPNGVQLQGNPFADLLCPLEERHVITGPAGDPPKGLRSFGMECRRQGVTDRRRFLRSVVSNLASKLDPAQCITIPGVLGRLRAGSQELGC
jgi:hypothetical protein